MRWFSNSAKEFSVDIPLEKVHPDSILVELKPINAETAKALPDGWVGAIPPPNMSQFEHCTQSFNIEIL
jgi:hypothetical protein